MQLSSITSVNEETMLIRNGTYFFDVEKFSYIQKTIFILKYAVKVCKIAKNISVRKH